MMTKRVGLRRRVRRPAGMLLVLAATAALLVLAIAGPALAKKPDGSKVKVRPVACLAEVTATDISANTLTVKVVKGKKANIGKIITFTLAKKAVIVKTGDGGADVVALSAVAVADRVVVHGRVDATVASAPVYTAWLVLDRGPAPPK
jgi:hypothetical protein